MCAISHSGDGASYRRTRNAQDSCCSCDAVSLNMELSGAGFLFFCECRRPADPPAGGAGSVEAGARAFADEGSLILRERTSELVEHSPQGC